MDKPKAVIIRIIGPLILLARRKNKLKLLSTIWKIFRLQGFSGLYQAYIKFNSFTLGYKDWVSINDSLSEDDKKAILSSVSQLKWRPVISILMPTYNTPERWLKIAIESVRSQLYPFWELCIADDASTDKKIYLILNEYAELDKRIKIIYREKNGHISEASNTALKIASGDFIALLDHDDQLPEHALFVVAAALNNRPELDMIYSDEDTIDEQGSRFNPYFKSDWNPDLLLGQNMVNHLGVYRTELVRSLGGFRKGFEGSQDWDLALRISECISPANIYHIPHILYHWRAVKGSTAMGHDEKSYTIKASTKVLSDHLARTGQKGTVTPTEDGYFRVRYDIPDPNPMVSIIIPTRNGLSFLRQCIDSIKSKTQYSNYEILVVNNLSDDTDTLQYLHSLNSAGTIRLLQYNSPFNYSAINNYAVRSAKGDYLCLMNNDIEIISEDWIDEMLGHAGRKEIGAVGAMLYFTNDTIQHAGVLLGMGGIAGHLYANHPRGSRGYRYRATLVQNLSAVTAACLMLRKEIYGEVGGMDENLPVAFNDVDFCLRIMSHGYYNLWTPFAELYHHESATRGYDDTHEKKKQFEHDCEYLKSRWDHLIKFDPFYNPNLSLNDSWPYLAPIPRVKKPWE